MMNRLVLNCFSKLLGKVANTHTSLQGQFFPFFILTLTGLVTFPLTYNLLKPSKGQYRHLS